MRILIASQKALIRGMVLSFFLSIFSRRKEVKKFLKTVLLQLRILIWQFLNLNRLVIILKDLSNGTTIFLQLLFSKFVWSWMELWVKSCLSRNTSTFSNLFVSMGSYSLKKSEVWTKRYSPLRHSFTLGSVKQKKTFWKTKKKLRETYQCFDVMSWTYKK